MPEVILPCPACGDDCIIVAKNYPSGKWHTYCYCGHIGRLYPTRKESIAAHNALPRAMTWTHEPPKVAGKYWWRDKRHPDEASIINVTQTKIDGYRRNPIGEYEQFAGPISPPID